MTRRPKIKAADVDWSRVARNCYQGKSGRLHDQREQAYNQVAQRADPDKYRKVCCEARDKAVEDYMAVWRG